MDPTTVASLISGGGLLLSLLGAAWISGTRWGTVNHRLTVLEQAQTLLATKEQLAGMKEDMAEIKGMFRLELRDRSTNSDGR